MDNQIFTLSQIFRQPEGTVFETVTNPRVMCDNPSIVKVIGGILHVRAGGWVECIVTESWANSRFFIRDDISNEKWLTDET